MKTFKYIIISMLSLAFSMNALSATLYVSDNIVIYLHSGPSFDYRITGTIQVGAPVTTLEYDEESKFMQIKTEKGKIGWVKSEDLQKELPASILLPKVTKQLQSAQKELADIAIDNEKSQQEDTQLMMEKEDLIASLQSEESSLQKTIEELKARNLELDLLQSTKDERIKMEWLMYGGSVLFFGLLLGLIIPFLPRRQKRKNSW